MMRPLSSSIAGVLLLLVLLPAPTQAHHGEPPEPMINCNPDCPTLGEGCESLPIVDYALCFAGDVLSYGPADYVVDFTVWTTFYVACHVVWSAICNLS